MPRAIRWDSSSPGHSVTSFQAAKRHSSSRPCPERPPTGSRSSRSTSYRWARLPSPRRKRGSLGVRVLLGWVPPAAERLDQTNAGAHLPIDDLGQRQLVGEERPLRVDDDQVIGQALLVLHV